MNAASRWATQSRAGLVSVILLMTMAQSVTAQERTADEAASGAQQTAGRGDTFLGGGVTLALGSTTVGGATGRKVGVGFLGIIADVKNNGLRRYSLDLQYDPFKVQNPQRDERYSSFSAVASAYLGIVGLGIGWQERFWSGSDVWASSDGGIAFQLTLAGPLVPVSQWAVSPSAFVRVSGWNEITTAAMGLRLPFGRRSG